MEYFSPISYQELGVYIESYILSKEWHHIKLNPLQGGIFQGVVLISFSVKTICIQK